MMTIQMPITIPADHVIRVTLPDTVPQGPAKLTVKAARPEHKGWRIPLISWLQDRETERKRRVIMRFAGCLKNNSEFQGDAVELQRKWRAEWDRPWDNDA